MKHQTIRPFFIAPICLLYAVAAAPGYGLHKTLAAMAYNDAVFG